MRGGWVEFKRSPRNIHAGFGAKMPENAHGYCVQHFETNEFRKHATVAPTNPYMKR
jgi:hypothetical protein